MGDENLEPQGVGAEHRPRRDGKIGDRPRVEEDGTHGIPEIQTEGHVEPPCSDMGAARLERLRVPTELVGYTMSQGVQDVLALGERALVTDESIRVTARTQIPWTY